MTKNIASVTGASSGMGREFVLQIAAKYGKLDEIWAIARREELLWQLQGEAALPVRILTMDLAQEESIKRLMALLATENPRIRILVNSAGCGRIGNFFGSSYEGVLSMINVNCKALTAVTYACLPYMPMGSRILMLASSAAFAPQPGFAVYAASKAYVLSFSRALRVECQEQGLTVTAVCPGPVDTEFFDHAGDNAKMSAVKKLTMAKPVPVVKRALFDAARGHELSVYGLPMKGSLVAAKLIPHHLLVPAMNKILNRRSRDSE